MSLIKNIKPYVTHVAFILPSEEESPGLALVFSSKKGIEAFVQMRDVVGPIDKHGRIGVLIVNYIGKSFLTLQDNLVEKELQTEGVQIYLPLGPTSSKKFETHLKNKVGYLLLPILQNGEDVKVYFDLAIAKKV